MQIEIKGSWGEFCSEAHAVFSEARVDGKEKWTVCWHWSASADILCSRRTSWPSRCVQYLEGLRTTKGTEVTRVRKSVHWEACWFSNKALVSDLCCSCWEKNAQLEVMLGSALSPKGQSHRAGRRVHGQKGFDAACAQRPLHKRCSGPLTGKVAEYKKPSISLWKCLQGKWLALWIEGYYGKDVQLWNLKRFCVVACFW